MNLSIARAMSGNEPNVAKWFHEYKQVLHDLRIVSPEQIWSGDESGVQNIPKERKVIAVVKKPCVSTVGADKGETTSILTFVNGVGLWVPPMIIHKGSRVQAAWLQDCPVGVRVGATSKGYITKEKFLEYGVRFIQYLRSHKLLDRKHLLIIDSHKSHVYNVAFFDLMKEHQIYVLAIPPHTSHIVQALDSTPFANFKRYWQAALLEWNNAHKGAILDKPSFFQVFWPAFKRSMTVAAIQSGFRKTGIYPVNFEAIDKAKFTPAQVTDSKIYK